MRRSLEDGLQRLGLDRADALLPHDIGVMMHRSEHARHHEIGACGIGITLQQQAPFDDLRPVYKARGTSVVCGGPCNSGLLAGGETWTYAAAPADLIARRDRLREVCAAHGVALEAAALQFPLAHPSVACVIPGSRTAEEARASLAHLRTPIPEALWSELASEGLLRADAPLPRPGVRGAA